MIRKQHGAIQWLEFELFVQFPKLQHGVFLRHGGVSTGTYESLNCGYGVGDSPDNVKINLDRVCSILNISCLAQVRAQHGCDITSITQANSKEIHFSDASTTAEPDIGLMIKHADCQAAIFYDPVNHAIANVHSGWKGSVQNIYGKTVEMMRATYGTAPQNLHVGISPSLGPDEAEFINFRQELPQHFWEYQIKPSYFNFWEISRSQLIQSGVLNTHIQIANICTKSHPEDYFSHRFNNQSGRNATVIKLIKM